MTFKEVIELIRDLCNRHPEINGFYTGLESQHDDHNIQYPAVRVVFPYEIVPVANNDESVILRLKLTVMVNKARLLVGADYEHENVNYQTENSVINEIDNDLLLENNLREQAIRLATHIKEFLILSEDNYSFFSVRSAKIIGIERSGADYTTGVNLMLDLQVGNPYICEAIDIFNGMPSTSLTPASGMNVWLSPKIGFSPEEWQDMSDFSNNFLQPDISKQLSINPYGINNKPSVSCGGTGYMYLFGTAIASDSFTMHVVLKNTGNPVVGFGVPVAISTTNYPTVGTKYVQINTQGGIYYNINAFEVNLRRSNLVISDSTAKLITLVKTPTTMEYRVNGVSIDMRTATQLVDNVGHFLGASAGNFFVGEIGDFIFYNFTQNAQDLAKTEQYLIAEYSL